MRADLAQTLHASSFSFFFLHFFLSFFLSFSSLFRLFFEQKAVKEPVSCTIRALFFGPSDWI